MNLKIRVNGDEIVIDHENCKVYRFRNLPELDHAYFDDDERQFYMFNCEVLMNTMESQGFRTIIDDYPSENDYDAYVRCSMQTIDEEIDEELGGP